MLRTNHHPKDDIQIGDIVAIWRDGSGWLHPARVTKATPYSFEVVHNKRIKTSGFNRTRLLRRARLNASPSTTAPHSNGHNQDPSPPLLDLNSDDLPPMDDDSDNDAYSPTSSSTPSTPQNTPIPSSDMALPDDLQLPPSRPALPTPELPVAPPTPPVSHGNPASRPYHPVRSWELRQLLEEASPVISRSLDDQALATTTEHI